MAARLRPTDTVHVNDTGDNALALIRDLAFHASQAERIARELSTYSNYTAQNGVKAGAQVSSGEIALRARCR